MIHLLIMSKIVNNRNGWAVLSTPSLFSKGMLFVSAMFCLPLMIVVFCGLLTDVQSGNVTNVAQYVPQHDDLCTNECSETDPRYWCGGYKEDATGRVMRCVQYTKRGQTCVAECGGKKKYNWCLTNHHSLSEGDWWDYCSLVGFTINKE